MDYSKIRVLQMQKNLSDRKFADSIGLSGPGYKSMLENHTCTIETLETICQIHGVSPSYFFDEPESNFYEPTTKYGKCKDCLKKDERIKLLTEQIESKDKEIIRLSVELDRIQPGEREKAS